MVSGHVPPGDPRSTIPWEALARTQTTLVVLMGVAHLAAICAALTGAGLDPATPAAVVEDGCGQASAIIPLDKLMSSQPDESLAILARAVIRRAERETVALAREEEIGDQVLPLINRLSDLFFTLARLVNVRAGTPEVPWTARRPPSGEER